MVTDPGSTVTVSISPTTASIQGGMTQQFTATVSPSGANQSVIWSVSGTGCTGTGCGVIDAAGKYTAPATPHFAPGLIVTATSVANPSSKATAVVFVMPAPTGVAISPTIATVQGNGVQQFTATGGPFGAIPVVTWGVSGTGCAGASCGTIDSSGRYTAPATSPNPATVTVTATSVVGSSVSGSATVILGNNPNNSKLHGQYAFLAEGYDGDGELAMAGSFVADGTGNITAGVADYNFSSAIFVATNLAFTGTYSIGADNRGSMTITVSSPHAFPSGFSQTFALALGSFTAGVAGRGRLIELDGTDIWATGLLAKQDQASFSTAALNGGYAFGLGGTSSTGFRLVSEGRFTANGGSLSAGQADVFGLGVSFHGSGTPSAALDLPFSGTYNVSATGRGAAQLTFSGQNPGFSNFNFYVVSANELLLIEVDTCPAGGQCSFKGGISGSAFRQSGDSFSANSLNGAAVFTLRANNDVTVGEETFDGVGGLEGVNDDNNGGEVRVDVPFGGSYAVDSNGLGRGVINISGDPNPKPFYLVSPSKGFIIDTGGSAGAGMFEPQAGAPFDNLALSGNYVLGTFPWPFNWSFSPGSGVVTADGVGTINGTLDGKDGDGDGSGSRPTGSYMVAPNGRTTATITPSVGTPSNWVFYLISQSKAVAIRTDPGATNHAVRIIEK